MASGSRTASNSPRFLGLCISEEHQERRSLTVRDADVIVGMNLARGHQIRQRLYQQAFDSALQVARAIPEMSAFHQQELPGAIGDIDEERLAGSRRPDALLHHLKLNVDNLAQFLVAQRLEDYDLVQTVNELRRKLAPGGGHTGARHPVAEF